MACVVLGHEAEALDFAPWPGELGERVLANVSKPGWEQWLARQTMLLNEKRLSPMDPALGVERDLGKGCCLGLRGQCCAIVSRISNLRLRLNPRERQKD